jgi:hypothetical protein
MQQQQFFEQPRQQLCETLPGLASEFCSTPGGLRLGMVVTRQVWEEAKKL